MVRVCMCLCARGCVKKTKRQKSRRTLQTTDNLCLISTFTSRNIPDKLAAGTETSQCQLDIGHRLDRCKTDSAGACLCPVLCPVGI